MKVMAVALFLAMAVGAGMTYASIGGPCSSVGICNVGLKCDSNNPSFACFLDVIGGPCGSDCKICCIGRGCGCY
jgi:hypothetical protein